MVEMTEARIGILGGSGLYRIDGIGEKESVQIDTPFGSPSDTFELGVLEGRKIAFLPRHGRGHRHLPSEINYRANIHGMKQLGVNRIISVSAVGSLKKEIRPLDIVLVDQFFDRSKRSTEQTFFGDGIAGHVMFAHPICEDLQRLLYDVAKAEAGDVQVHPKGTYLNIEGPAFSTRAESLTYQSWGIDVIGMTNMTEARLAREAEICYASMAMVTDYDCWKEDEAESTVSVDMIIENLNRNISLARRILKKAIPLITEERSCGCGVALDNAVITSRDRMPKQTLDRMELILARVLNKA